jgi:ribosomal protein L36
MKLCKGHALRTFDEPKIIYNVEEPKIKEKKVANWTFFHFQGFLFFCNLICHNRRLAELLIICDNNNHSQRNGFGSLAIYCSEKFTVRIANNLSSKCERVM